MAKERPETQENKGVCFGGKTRGKVTQGVVVAAVVVEPGSCLRFQ